MTKITVEELAHASCMWPQTYMSTVAMAGVASATEQGCLGTPIIKTPLATMTSTMIPSLGV